MCIAHRRFRVTGTTLSSADLDPRRRMILVRCWRRGMREMDILYGTFADAHLPTLSDTELDDLEALMEMPDRDVFRWLSDEDVVPANWNTPIFQRIKAFHTHAGPVNV
jgi:antitoxin CptB